MNAWLIFLVPFFSGIIIIPVLVYISQKTNFLVDVPDGDELKIHKKNIPLSGGIAMGLSITAGLFVFYQPHVPLKMLGIMGGFLVIFLLGLWDDVKWKHVSTIKPKIKLLLLIVCTLMASVILLFVDIHFDFLPMPIISMLLGFVYIFVSINSINYQDGMDGLAGGEVLISLAAFLLLSSQSHNGLALVISVVTMGAVFSFLIFNLSLFKIFMGDSGAYSLGFILTVLAMLLSKPYNLYSIFGPLCIIGLPIFDGVFTNMRRLVNHKSIFFGDRLHIYDRFLQKGFSTKKTLAICYGLQVISVILGLAITLQNY